MVEGIFFQLGVLGFLANCVQICTSRLAWQVEWFLLAIREPVLSYKNPDDPLSKAMGELQTLLSSSFGPYEKFDFSVPWWLENRALVPRDQVRNRFQHTRRSERSIYHVHSPQSTHAWSHVQPKYNTYV